jgi:hypothetical protein
VFGGTGPPGRVRFRLKLGRLFDMRFAFVAAAAAGALLLLPGTASARSSPSMVRSETLACFSQQRDATDSPWGKLPSGQPYVGLSVANAERRAHRSGDGYRIVAKDGRCLPGYADLEKNRVNFWIVRGKVIEALFF